MDKTTKEKAISLKTINVKWWVVLWFDLKYDYVWINQKKKKHVSNIKEKLSSINFLGAVHYNVSMILAISDPPQC